MKISQRLLKTVVVTLSVAVLLSACHRDSSTSSGAYNSITYTTSTGFGSDKVNGVYATGTIVYAATDGGLSISTNNGSSWRNYTTADGLGSNKVNGVHAAGATICAATDGGLSISTDNGVTWNNYTATKCIHLLIRFMESMFQVRLFYAAVHGGLYSSSDNGATWNGLLTYGQIIKNVYVSGATIYAAVYGPVAVTSTSGALQISSDNGLHWNSVSSAQLNGVYASGPNIYAASASLFTPGLFVSFDNGLNWTHYRDSDGLGSSAVNGVYAIDSTIYAATSAGLSISTDSGSSWRTYTTAEGLGSNVVRSVYVSDSIIFAATDGGLTKLW